MRPIAFAQLVLVATAVALAVAWYNLVRLQRARSAMTGLLAREGCTLVSAKLCWVARGPFATAIAAHQPVYRVVARDRFGRLRQGWVRCQPFSDNAELAWEA